MRMRKKKNLTPRMERCEDCWVRTPKDLRGRWRTLYPEAKELHVEIGCGKGRFTVEMAKTHPDILFVAVERVLDAMVVAMERVENAKLTNVYFIGSDAREIPEIFASGEVDSIYLNFSDPWPGSRHAKRRLTHHNFLLLYREVLKEGGTLQIKTDNAPLFDFSVKEIPQYGFTLSDLTYDLHKNGPVGVMTDYEQKFYEQGLPIKRCVATMIPWEMPASTKRICSSMEEYIGSTPLLRLHRLERAEKAQAKLLAKLECCNPAGNTKIRAAKYMLDAAEERGELLPGGTIIEPTSGNMGIALAAIAAVRGYHCVIVMPEDMSAERIRTMRAYSAEVVLSPADQGMSGAVKLAEQIQNEHTGSILMRQFENSANALAHYETTGPEIWRDSGCEVDILVAGVGTGGSITGVGRYLKEQDDAITVVAVEPSDSPLLSEGWVGVHKIQGIGANFIPTLLDRSVIDEIITVTAEDAYRLARVMATKEGILVGISSGAALAAAVELSRCPENQGKSIAVILPDTGERYLSTGLFPGGVL